MPNILQARRYPKYKIYRLGRRWQTYWEEGRHYTAPIDPYKILYVSPHRINKKPKEKPTLDSSAPSGVVGGGWDLDTEILSEVSPTHKSIVAHFEEGVDWEDTEEYQIGVSKVERGDYSFGISSWGPCKSLADIDRRFNAIDELYENIKQNGYHSQKELQSGDGGEMVGDLRKNMRKPPEFREITVDIGRDGEFLWKGGIHRLTIAKVLDVETIPVRVRIRHEQWQNIRDRVYEGDDPPQHIDSKHPDLQF